MKTTTPTSAPVDDIKARARTVVRALRKTFPDAECSLTFSTPLELLIATILSAQCTDKMVNSITPRLFAKYRSAADWAMAPIEQIESDIKSTGFFHNKAKNIQKCCQELIVRFDSEVPNLIKDLITLPGIGRKTANVLLAAVWNQPAIIVDTHVTRLANRLGLTTEQDAVKIEFDLQALLPKKDWTFLSHALILHGRTTCLAKKPNCADCVLNKVCPSAFTFR